jgi:hypothetical protein
VGKDCFTKHVTEGKIEKRIEVMGTTYWMTLRKRGDIGNRSYTLENLLWKRLWTCHKTDYAMNER